jgi:hypothetical protein
MSILFLLLVPLAIRDLAPKEATVPVLFIRLFLCSPELEVLDLLSELYVK